MSDRERWIVYPLLFLAIGLGMDGTLTMQAGGHGGDAEVVRCKALEVMGPEGKPTVKITSSTKGDGLIETGNAEGVVESRLGGNVTGATLELLDRDGRIYALVGHNGDLVGLFAGDTENGRVLPLISVVSRPPANEKGNEKKSAEPKKGSEAKENSGATNKTSDGATDSGAPVKVQPGTSGTPAELPDSKSTGSKSEQKE